MLNDNEVCRRLNAVELGPVQGVLDRLSFIAVGLSSEKKYKCDIVLREHFPPEVEGLIDGLELGGETARAIIRRLSAHQSIPPHVDDWMPGGQNWRRFQVPLTSHPDIKMRWPGDGIEEHLAPGYLYEVRFDRTHEVMNDTDSQRIHLQIDQLNATI